MVSEGVPLAVPTSGNFRVGLVGNVAFESIGDGTANAGACGRNS